MDSNETLMDLELRFKKEKGQSAEFNTKGYCLQYVWWLEHKVLALEKNLRMAKICSRCGTFTHDETSCYECGKEVE